MGLTKAKPFNDMIKSVWESRVKSHYNGVSKYSSENEKNGTSSVTKRQTIKSFDAANEVMKNEIGSWIDSGGLLSKKGDIPGYNYAQNSWQMMGGPNGDPLNDIYTGTPEQKERAKGLMVDSMKLAYGSETSITNYGVTETELNEAKATKVDAAMLSIAEQGGISIYPFPVDDKDMREGMRKYDLKVINKALGLPEDNEKVDLKTIKANYTKLSKNDNLLAINLLNSMNSSPDQSSKLYYQGLEIQKLFPEADIEDLDSYYRKEGSGATPTFAPISFSNGYSSFEKELLRAMALSKQYRAFKQSDIQDLTDPYLEGSIDKLNEKDFTNPEFLRSYYQSNQT